MIYLTILSVAELFYKGKNLENYFSHLVLIENCFELRFSEKMPPNNFVRSNKEDNTSRQLNSRGTTNLPLLILPFATHQKS